MLKDCQQRQAFFSKELNLAVLGPLLLQYYDVWRLLKENKFKDSEVRKLLKMKCELNGVKYDPGLLFDEKRLSEA
jgi:hypothetical protein